MRKSKKFGSDKPKSGFDKKRPGGARFERKFAPRRPPESAQQSSTPKGRIVVGVHATKELFKVRPKSVTDVWLRDNYEGHPDLEAIFAQCERLRIRCTLKAAGNMDRVASVHQGVIAFSSETPELNWSAIKAAEKCILVLLDEVEDPHNLGAIMRTAWLLGASGILLPELRSASLNATVSKVAQGAVEHIPVMQESGLLETLKQLKELGFWAFGLSHDAPQTLYQTDLPDKVVWLLGSESGGLRKPFERECDQLVSIPQTDPTASFNVSVAAAIALSENARQLAVKNHE
jgi:23S rRNA (guanosine2251-2'-O)-methyltransferase